MYSMCKVPTFHLITTSTPNIAINSMIQMLNGITCVSVKPQALMMAGIHTCILSGHYLFRIYTIKALGLCSVHSLSI